MPDYAEAYETPQRQEQQRPDKTPKQDSKIPFSSDSPRSPNNSENKKKEDSSFISFKKRPLKKEESPSDEGKKPSLHKGKKKSSQAVSKQEPEEETNLPSYYRGDRSGIKASNDVLWEPARAAAKLKGLKSGDLVEAVVDQAITASPSVPTPIRAMAISSRYKGSYFLGEATLDPELKRVLLSFTKLRLSENDQVYALRATGLSPKGAVGLVGEYHTEAGKFFLAEMGAATAAGLLDSTINRQQTAFGGYVQEPSLTNSAKGGAVTALSRTADRAAEGVRSAPQYTELEGYQKISIILQEDPTELD